MALKEGVEITAQPEFWVEDGGHYLPNHEWADVKRHARLVNFYDPATTQRGLLRMERTAVVTRALAPVVTMTNTTKHNGMSGMVTQLFVQHDAECPLEAGFAVSLTNWANNPVANGGPIASWHSFVDPGARVRMVPWYYAAWVQGYANPFSIGMEVAGYAKFTRAQWRTALGLQQLENLAHEWLYYWQIEKSNGNIIPLRWLTTDQVNQVMAGNRSIKGFCTHGQIEPGSRWDPGPNFPYDELMDRLAQLVSPYTPDPITPPKEMFTVTQFNDLMEQGRKTLSEATNAKVAANKALAQAEENERKIAAMPEACAKAFLAATYPLEGSFKGKTSDVETRFAFMPHEQHRGVAASKETTAAVEELTKLIKAFLAEAAPANPPTDPPVAE